MWDTENHTSFLNRPIGGMVKAALKINLVLQKSFVTTRGGGRSITTWDIYLLKATEYIIKILKPVAKLLPITAINSLCLLLMRVSCIIENKRIPFLFFFVEYLNSTLCSNRVSMNINEASFISDAGGCREREGGRTS